MFKTWLFEYHHDGKNWSFEIQAPTLEDAQARVNKLAFAKPCGELIAKIPARLGLFAKLVCTFRNFFISDG